MFRSIALAAAMFLLAPAEAHSAAMSASYRDTIGNWEIVGTDYAAPGAPDEFVCDASFSDGKHEFNVSLTHKHNDWVFEIGGPEGSKKSSHAEIQHLLLSPTIEARGKDGKIYEMKTNGSEELLESFNKCPEQIIEGFLPDNRGEDGE